MDNLFKTKLVTILGVFSLLFATCLLACENEADLEEKQVLSYIQYSSRIEHKRGSDYTGVSLGKKGDGLYLKVTSEYALNLIKNSYKEGKALGGKWGAPRKFSNLENLNILHVKIKNGKEEPIGVYSIQSGAFWANEIKIPHAQLENMLYKKPATPPQN